MGFISFTVLGAPVAKGRPKFTKKGFAYTPAKTKKAEDSFLTQALQFKPSTPISEPLTIDITSILPIPKSTSKKNYILMMTDNIKHTKRPDLDNLLKLVEDSLNGIFFIDDSQIYSISAKKKYGVVPKTIVTLEWIDNE